MSSRKTYPTFLLMNCLVCILMSPIHLASSIANVLTHGSIYMISSTLGLNISENSKKTLVNLRLFNKYLLSKLHRFHFVGLISAPVRQDRMLRHWRHFFGKRVLGILMVISMLAHQIILLYWSQETCLPFSIFVVFKSQGLRKPCHGITCNLRYL